MAYTEHANLAAGWLGFVLGTAAGAVSGLFFRREHWAGGYGSWRRRLVRLAHVSFFGIGWLNLSYAFTVRLAPVDADPVTGGLLLAAAGLMPAVCYLAAWRTRLRHLFPLPVVCVLAACLRVAHDLLGR